MSVDAQDQHPKTEAISCHQVVWLVQWAYAMEASELPTPSRRVSPSKVERFAFRLSPDDRRLLEKAAALRRTTLTRFVLESSREVAERALA